MMLYRPIKTCLSVVLCSTLIACGGGGGSTSGSNSASNNAVETPSTMVEGSAVKGVIKNGLVSAYSITAGGLGDLLSSTTTDESGNYVLNLDTYSGPVYIEITAANDTLMTCDVASGCGDFIGISDLDTNENGFIDFGEDFAVPSDFTLTAAGSIGPGNETINITTLTHMAAQLAASYPQGFNEISILVALSQVENLFGLSNLLSTGTIDLTNPSAVANATEDMLESALLSSALLGLTNDISFPQVLSDLTAQLINNNGQLVINGSSNSIPSLEELFAEAVSTAQSLNLDQLTTTLQTAHSNLLSADSGTLTDALPSPTAGGSTAAQIDAYLADLDVWQGTLSLNPETTAFSNIVSAIGVSSGTDLTEILKAVSIAGQFGPIVSLPDAALDAACDSLSNYIARLACNAIIADTSLQDICEATIQQTVLGIPLCNILNNLTLPLGNGLWGKFALYDGTARIYGTTDNIELDIYFSSNRQEGDAYEFTIDGTAESSKGLLTIESGNFSVLFDGGLNVAHLKLPEQATGELSVSYEQWNEDSGSSNYFDGELSINIDLSSVRETEDSDAPYAGLEDISAEITAIGSFESSYGDIYNGSISFTGGNGNNVALVFEVDLPDYSDTASVTLVSSVAHMAEGKVDQITLAWPGKEYDIEYIHSPNAGLRITNQDGITMDLDLSVDDDSVAGYISLDGTYFGTVYPLNGSLLLEMSSGSDWVF